MARQNMETEVLKLFFEEPTKHWHFKELRQETNLADSKLSKWLRRFQNKKIILKIKDKGKMPYYIGNYGGLDYQYRKKLFAQNVLYESGFLNHLVSLKKTKSIVIFGSFSRSDWYKESDIDLFIYGNPSGLNLSKYELILKRDIQFFTSKDEKELKRMGSGLLRNIINGNVIKGVIPKELIENAAV